MVDEQAATSAEFTARDRLRRAVWAARRELRSPPPVVWELVDPRVPNDRFGGRQVVVTGAAGLIGSKLVESFVAGGALVHAVDIDGPGLDRLVQLAPDLVTAHPVDLGDPIAISALAERLARVDILVNNVGANDDARGPHTDADSWRRVLEVNLIGPALLTGHLAERLRATNDAAVVFVTSVNAAHPSPWLHYGAAKAALAKVVVDLAHQLAPDGVRVNAVAPGKVVPAEMPAIRRAVAGGALGGGAVPVEAVVHAVLFLCDSRLSPMTTGQQLVVDGATGPFRDGLYDTSLLDGPAR